MATLSTRSDELSAHNNQVGNLCEVCQMPIIHPAQHEYCSPKDYVPPAPPPEPDPYGHRPPHYYKRDPMPVQKPIKHEFAPRAAKPPINSTGHERRVHDDIDDNSKQDTARKVVEDL